MIEILKHLHRYVPTAGEGSRVIQIGFAGDQLTAARAREAIASRVNSQDQHEALRGLFPFACDWHAKVNFMSMSALSVFLISACMYLSLPFSNHPILCGSYKYRV